MTVAELLARARSAINTGTMYKLGAGGMVPTAALPKNKDSQCDCSGFTSWAIGRSRQTSHPLYVRLNGGWINTDAMVKDATDCTGFFTKLDAPKVGCFVVYPGGPGGKIGHVGIVTALVAGAVKSVVHCSSGNYRAFGDAIQETSPAVFRRPDALYAWFEGIDR